MYFAYFYYSRFVTIQSPAADSVGNFVAAIGGVKGFLAEHRRLFESLL
jgi:hypothetical protein